MTIYVFKVELITVVCIYIYIKPHVYNTNNFLFLSFLNSASSLYDNVLFANIEERLKLSKEG